MRNPRSDFLGETVDGDLVHVELQSGNDMAMPLRMASELRAPGVLFQCPKAVKSAIL